MRKVRQGKQNVKRNAEENIVKLFVGCPKR